MHTGGGGILGLKVLYRRCCPLALKLFLSALCNFNGQVMKDHLLLELSPVVEWS